MSIRPTDLQIIVQKTHEVERLQQNQQQQSKTQQQQFAGQLQKQSEVKERQVNSSPHADEITIRHKEKDAGQKSLSKEERSQADEKSAKDDKDSKIDKPKKEHIIDIKI